MEEGGGRRERAKEEEGRRKGRRDEEFVGAELPLVSNYMRDKLYVLVASCVPHLTLGLE